MNYEYKTMLIRATWGNLENTDDGFFAKVDNTMNSMATKGWEYVNNFSNFQSGGGRFVALIFRKLRK